MYDPLKDMINRPSRLAMDLAEIMVRKKEEANARHLGRFRLFRNIRLDKYSQEAHLRMDGFVSGFTPAEDVSKVLDQFEEVCGLMAEAELMIAYTHRTEGESQVGRHAHDHMQQAIEDMKTGKMSTAEFRNAYGYYAQRPFDPSSMRYSEYDDADLMELEASVRDIQETDEGKLFPRYAALREELRHCAVRLVAALVPHAGKTIEEIRDAGTEPA